MRYSIEINASKEKIWEVLWSDPTLRKWAGIIDEGTYLDGELEEGNEVNFMSASGYGVTSRVEELVPYQRMVFKQIADVKVSKDGSLERREKQWEGGLETYELKDSQGHIELSLEQDVPDELVEYFEKKIPEALECIKTLAEAK